MEMEWKWKWRSDKESDAMLIDNPAGAARVPANQMRCLTMRATIRQSTLRDQLGLFPTVCNREMKGWLKWTGYTRYPER